MRIGAIADDMLLPPIEHQLNRCVGLAGEVCCDYPFIAGAKLGPEPPTHELSDHPHLALRQFEDVGEFLANAGSTLCRSVDRHFLRLPINHETVCLERRMRLHLGEVLALDDDVRFSKTL